MDGTSTGTRHAIAWERRWSELRRWQLYAGPDPAGRDYWAGWIMRSRTSQGQETFFTLFWHNVIRRFTKSRLPAGLDYTTAHRNTAGKYFLELPVYLLPWTLLVAAALRRAWMGRIPRAGRHAVAVRLERFSTVFDRAVSSSYRA